MTHWSVLREAKVFTDVPLGSFIFSGDMAWEIMSGQLQEISSVQLMKAYIVTSENHKLVGKSCLTQLEKSYLVMKGTCDSCRIQLGKSYLVKKIEG